MTNKPNPYTDRVPDMIAKGADKVRRMTDVAHRGSTPADGVHRRGDCARMGCPQDCGMLDQPEDRRREFALAHGYVEVDGHLFCSKRCAVIHEHSPDGASRVMRPIVAKEKSSDPTGLHTYELPVSDGTMMAWVQCGYRDICQHRFEVPASADMSARARAAVAHGYVQTPHGWFCSGTCAKRAAVDVAMRTEAKPGQQSAERAAAGHTDGLEKLPPDLEAFEVCADEVAQAVRKMAQGRDIRLLLGLGTNPPAVALVEYPPPGPSANQRRAEVFRSDSLEEACLRAVDAVGAFVVGQVGRTAPKGVDIFAREVPTGVITDARGTLNTPEGLRGAT